MALQKNTEKRKTRSGRTYELLAIGKKARGYFLLLRSGKTGKEKLFRLESKDGAVFSERPTAVRLRTKDGKDETISHCHDFRFSYSARETMLTYTKETPFGKSFVCAGSPDEKTWNFAGETRSVGMAAAFVPAEDSRSLGTAYFGEDRLFAGDLYKTRLTHYDIPRVPAWNFFDGSRFAVIGAEVTPEGIFVFYGTQTKGSILHNSDITKENSASSFKIGAAIFDAADRGKVIWQSSSPVAEFPLPVGETFSSLGTTLVTTAKGRFIRLYGAYGGAATQEKVVFIDLPAGVVRTAHTEKAPHATMAAKSRENPIIRPSDKPWENEGAFNPTAVDIDGKVRLLYRAIGTDGISRLGYAESLDGIRFDSFLAEPAFAVWKEEGRNKASGKRFDPTLYPSGGSWGGCEDPRLTRIGKRLYMTFNIFDGWDFIRIGLSSIAEDDFKKQRWNWREPQLISPPGQIHKNWVVFPEKIDGKFAILHSVSPKVEIAYREDIEAIGKAEPFIESPQGARTAGRRGFWDSRVRGVGGSPIKTSAGWLIFYHATDEYDPGKYKIGAMLLDLADPKTVIARSPWPLIVPDEWYENAGKPGIVYSCGAIERSGTVYIYYGGGDRVTCVATVPTQNLLDWLLSTNQPPGAIQATVIPLLYVRR